MSRRTEEARKAAAAGAFAATDAAASEEDGTTAAPAAATRTTTTAAAAATSASKEAGSAMATTRGGATRGATRGTKWGTKRPRHPSSSSSSSAAASSPSSSATATAAGRRRARIPGARPGRKGGGSRSGGTRGTRGRRPRLLRALNRVSEAVVPRRYRTDLPSSDSDDDVGGGGAKGSSSFASHPSGTIVAPRSRGATGGGGGGGGVGSDDEREDEEGEEAAAFVWIEDIRDGPSVETALKSLREEGFDVRSAAFVPFSSRERWEERHPRAKLRSAPDGGGSARASRTKKRKAQRTSTKRTKDSPKLLSRGALPDAERRELHGEMYEHLVWLRDELARMEGNGKDRRKVQASGISVPALKGLVCKMEATFRGLGSEEDARRRGPRTPAYDADKL